MLYYSILRCIISYCVVYCTTSHYATLHHTTLYYSALCYAMLQHPTILHYEYAMLRHAVLRYTILPPASPALDLGCAFLRSRVMWMWPAPGVPRQSRYWLRLCAFLCSGALCAWASPGGLCQSSSWFRPCVFAFAGSRRFWWHPGLALLVSVVCCCTQVAVELGGPGELPASRALGIGCALLLLIWAAPGGPRPIALVASAVWFRVRGAPNQSHFGVGCVLFRSRGPWAAPRGLPTSRAPGLGCVFFVVRGVLWMWPTLNVFSL